jgi:hypothetical protein
LCLARGIELFSPLVLLVHVVHVRH